MQQQPQGMSGGVGVNGASLQDMQRLQQQLQATYGRPQQQQQQGQMQMSSDFSGMNQQALMQQQQGRRGGNPAVTMQQLQQQQQQGTPGMSGQQQPNSLMGAASGGNAASIFGNWGGLQNQGGIGSNPGSTMDASSGSSARLMAMAGMGMNKGGGGGMMDNSSNPMQKMQALLQQQQQGQQPQNAQGMPNQNQAMSGNFAQQQQQLLRNQGMNAAGAGRAGVMGGQQDMNQAGSMNQQNLLFQQQFANLQKQMQQQQQGRGGQQAGGVAGNAVNALRGGNGNAMQGNMMQAGNSQANLLQARQQQLLQQMQKRNGGMMDQMGQQQDGRLMGMQGQQFPGQQVQQQQNQFGLQGQQQNQFQHRGSGTPLSMSGQPGPTNDLMGGQQQGSGGMGSLNEQQLRLHQQNLLRASGSQQTMGADAQTAARMMSGTSPNSNFSMAGAAGNAMQQQNPFQNMSATSSTPADALSGSQHGGAAQQQQLQQRGSVVNQAGGMDQSVHSTNNAAGGAPGQDGMMNAAGQQQQQQQQQQPGQQQAGTDGSAGATGATGGSEQKSFLDGKLVGGWQSNSDLPDRRQIIFHILDVIQNMRPESSKMSNKLAHMAKSLEEHLYRSARTKEEYMDMSTLKSRLQAIAHGLELHRPSSSGSMDRNNAHRASFQQNQSQAHPSQQSMSTAGGAQQGQTAEQQNASWNNQAGQQMQAGGMAGGANDLSGGMMRQTSMSQAGQNQMGNPGMANQMGATGQTDWAGGQGNNPMAAQSGGIISSSGSAFGQMNQMQQGNFGGMGNQQAQMAGSMSNQAGVTGMGGSSDAVPQQQQSRFQDPGSIQKKKVIRQQQERLLLLRHASKCRAGPSCRTKFCAQMVTLWRHMKTCRDKNCRTSHCLSSRCVLNHYRICKTNGQTATCEVCGPVMTRIKELERDDGSTDPLTGQQDPSGQSAGAASAAQGGGTEQNQIQQIQNQQMKLQARLENLQQLQKQQTQLLDQQRRLQEQAHNITDPNSQQAMQLQQQQMLLSKLQQRCQQQQLVLQQELQEQANMSGMNQFQAIQQPNQGLQAGDANQQMQGGVAAGANAMMNPGQPQDQTQQQQAGALQPPQAQDQQQQPGQQLPGQQQGNGGANSKAGSPSMEPRKRRSRSDGKGMRGGKGKRITSGKGKSITSILSAGGQNDVVKPKPGGKGAKKLRGDLDKSTVGPGSSNAEFTGPDIGTSLMSTMTPDEIVKHMDSLNKGIKLSSRTVTHKCMPVLQDLIEDQYGWVFNDAVDPVALGLPDYFDVVKNPMHLELVKKKLENAIYNTVESFGRDVRLVFENAILYNGESSEVGGLAQTMLNKFDVSYNVLVQGIETSHQQLEKMGESCSLCGSQKRRFEPTVLYCQGRCGMQRIQRQAPYYTDRTKQNHWCGPCYGLLKPEQPIALDDGSEVLKKDLQEFKNDALPEEGWVNCDECHSWVHQICALFNGRTNKSNATYTCPKCYLQKARTGQLQPETTLKGAQDLPQNNMSRAIENGLQAALSKAYEARAQELGVSVANVEKAEGLSVRVLSNVDKKHFVGDEMVRYYKAKGVQTEFPVRTKCIALFQRIHGADTLLFALYVYEYGQNCPAPNRRRVYISYLDSVKYFEPKAYRTTAYHAILVEYLRYVKRRGFHTAHLWSCPPTPGDDYIFYCHPEHQQFPREDMLRLWYHKMLEKAKAEGIVIRTTTLYDEYFSSDAAVDQGATQRFNATCLPYFEGDYIPGEVENIVKLLSSMGRPIASSAAKETAFDDVMMKLGHNLGKMKDNFVVVHLRNRRFAAAVERGEDVSSWKEDSDEELVRSKRAKISGKGAVGGLPGMAGVLGGGDMSGAAGRKPSLSLQDSAAAKAAEATGNAKRGFDEIQPAIARHMSGVKRGSETVPDTADEDPRVESEMFESRQQFLNYCQTTHCQFDELRRAKHSSMMVLFQLHNPTAPKFLQQCGACYVDITHGTRYHCNMCPDFDLCQDCYKPVTTGQWAKRDTRFAHDKTHTFTPVDTEATAETQTSRAEREKSLKAHIDLLEHAGSCSGPPTCSLHNCQRMKGLFDHVRTCETKPKKDCIICSRLVSLCAVHARMCAVRGNCPIPLCDRIRERHMRLRRQQQRMDDRRRQAQNELYHAGGA